MGLNSPKGLFQARNLWRSVECDVTDTQEVLRLAKRENPDAIFSLNDFGLCAAAFASSALGLPGFSESQARICVDKRAQKIFLRQHDLPSAFGVEFHDFGSLEAAWHSVGGGLCFVKPANAGGGSRGVLEVASLHEAVTHVRSLPGHFSRYGGILENSIDGTEHQVEVLLAGQSWEIVSFCDKINYTSSRTVVQYQLFPGPIANSRMRIIRRLVGQLVDALGPAHGALHIEVMTNSDSCTILGFSGRPGGAYNFAPVPELTMDVNYPGKLAEMLLGQPNSMSASATGSFVAIGHGEVPQPGSSEGYRFAGAHLKKKHSGNWRFVPYALEGAEWRGLSNDLARPGYFICQRDSAESALETVRRLVADHPVIIDSEQKKWKLVGLE